MVKRNNGEVILNSEGWPVKRTIPWGHRRAHISALYEVIYAKRKAVEGEEARRVGVHDDLLKERSELQDRVGDLEEKILQLTSHVKEMDDIKKGYDILTHLFQDEPIVPLLRTAERLAKMEGEEPAYEQVLGTLTKELRPIFERGMSLAAGLLLNLGDTLLVQKKYTSARVLYELAREHSDGDLGIALGAEARLLYIRSQSSDHSDINASFDPIASIDPTLHLGRYGERRILRGATRQALIDNTMRTSAGLFVRASYAAKQNSKVIGVTEKYTQEVEVPLTSALSQDQHLVESALMLGDYYFLESEIFGRAIYQAIVAATNYIEDAAVKDSLFAAVVERAKQARDEKQYDKCIYLCDLVIKRQPDNPHAHYFAGTAYELLSEKIAEESGEEEMKLIRQKALDHGTRGSDVFVNHVYSLITQASLTDQERELLFGETRAEAKVVRKIGIEDLCIDNLIKSIKMGSTEPAQKIERIVDAVSALYDHSLKDNFEILRHYKTNGQYHEVNETRTKLVKSIKDNDGTQKFLFEVAQELKNLKDYGLSEELGIALAQATANPTYWNFIGDIVLESPTAHVPKRIAWAQQCYLLAKKSG